jgi:hypothetical protein
MPRIAGRHSIIGQAYRYACYRHLKGQDKHIELLDELSRRYVRRHRPGTYAVEREDIAG